MQEYNLESRKNSGFYFLFIKWLITCPLKAGTKTTGFDSTCPTSPLPDTTLCTAGTLDIWTELTTYLRRRYFCLHAVLFTALFRLVVALCPLLRWEVGVGISALLKNTYIHEIVRFIGRGF